MRYRHILEAQALAAEEPAVEAAPAQTRVYYHVTTKQRLRSIEQKGIEPGHRRRWKTGFGQQLGERGYIYLMSDFSMAVRWAFKMQWEHFHGKPPNPSPYVIVVVREDPSTLEADPHPENGLYGHAWFQKQGAIAPSDIMKVIPLTPELIQQVVDGGTAVHESLLSSSVHNPSRAVAELQRKGWQETTVDGIYKDPNHPEYSVELNIHNPEAGPFSIFRRAKRIANVKVLPTAQQLALKDGLLDKPAVYDEPSQEWWRDYTRH